MVNRPLPTERCHRRAVVVVIDHDGVQGDGAGEDLPDQAFGGPTTEQPVPAAFGGAESVEARPLDGGQ